MIDYQEFIKASKETLNSAVSKENFDTASSYYFNTTSEAFARCQPDSEILTEVFPNFRNDNNNNNDNNFNSRGGTTTKTTAAALPTPAAASKAMAFSTSMKEQQQQQQHNIVESSSSSSSSSHLKQEKIITPRVLANSLSEEQIADLFVETCFFARLGFVQPPCCMQCTYRESLSTTTTTTTTVVKPNVHCGKWVIWRLDASKVLHPNSLGENIVAVKCHTARLLSTKAVVIDGYQWNSTTKTLTRREGGRND